MFYKLASQGKRSRISNCYLLLTILQGKDGVEIRLGQRSTLCHGHVEHRKLEWHKPAFKESICVAPAAPQPP
jgi:hypothetical protein